MLSRIPLAALGAVLVALVATAPAQAEPSINYSNFRTFTTGGTVSESDKGACLKHAFHTSNVAASEDGGPAPGPWVTFIAASRNTYGWGGTIFVLNIHVERVSGYSSSNRRVTCDINYAAPNFASTDPPVSTGDTGDYDRYWRRDALTWVEISGAPYLWSHRKVDSVCYARIPNDPSYFSC